MLALPARAKVNLDLEVIGRRADGYHEVRTRLQAIGLHDLLEVGPADQTSMSVSGFAVPTGADNLVLKAHRRLEEIAGRDLPTRLLLHKRIPPGSGLGGASSDAATALRAIAALHGLSTLDLAPIAAELGSDVPFFLTGGTAAGGGRGEQLVPLQHTPGWFALAWPGIELSTRGVYEAWDRVGGEGVNQLARAAVAADERIGKFAGMLGEDWQMTGSGSAFFSHCNDESTAGRRAAQAHESTGGWTAVTHSVGKWA